MPSPRIDPVLRSSRREALVVALLWLVAMSYTLSVSYLQGYGAAGEELRLVLGFPAWVFWGILLPWLGCVLFSIWFAYRFMTDEDLEGNGGDAGDTGGKGASDG